MRAMILTIGSVTNSIASMASVSEACTEADAEEEVVRVAKVAEEVAEARAVAVPVRTTQPAQHARRTLATKRP